MLPTSRAVTDQEVGVTCCSYLVFAPAGLSVSFSLVGCELKSRYRRCILEHFLEQSLVTQAQAGRGANCSSTNMTVNSPKVMIFFSDLLSSFALRMFLTFSGALHFGDCADLL